MRDRKTRFFNIEEGNAMGYSLRPFVSEKIINITLLTAAIIELGPQPHKLQSKAKISTSAMSPSSSVLLINILKSKSRKSVTY